MSEKKHFAVTPKAGKFVAGVRTPASGELWLTDSQARYELALGTIIPFDERPVAPVVDEAPEGAKPGKAKA